VLGGESVSAAGGESGRTVPVMAAFDEDAPAKKQALFVGGRQDDRR
jgi:hypothetical protein